MSTESQDIESVDPQLEVRLQKAHEAFRAHDYNRVIAVLGDVEAAFPDAYHTPRWARALIALGPAYLECGQLDKAQQLLERGAAWAREQGNRRMLGTFLHELGCVALRGEDMDRLFALSREAVLIALELGDSLLLPLPNLCVAHRALGRSELARLLLQNLFVHALRQCDARSLGICLNQLGAMYFDLDDCYTGLQCFLASIYFKRCIGNEPGIRISLTVLQDCLTQATTLHQDGRATRLLRRCMFRLRILAASLLDPNRTVHVNQDDVAASAEGPPPLRGWLDLVDHFRPLSPDPGGVATLLTAEHERAVGEMERAPGDILSARAVLEAALVQQFRALADGLALDALLCGETFDEGVWQQQLAAARAPVAPPADWFPRPMRTNWEGDGPDREAESSAAGVGDPRAEGSPPPTDWNTRRYRENLVRDSLARRRKRVTPSQLRDVRVRLYGGTVPLWNDNAINHQLQQLGSDFRVIFLGAWDISRALMCKALDAPPPVQLDPRFYFGRVAPLTAHCNGPLFDFAQEYAVSPYTRSNGLGCHHEGRAIVRSGLGRSMGIKEREWSLLPKPYTSVHVHELAHIVTDVIFGGRAGPEPFSYARLRWVDDLRADLRRFTEAPRSREEIEQVFAFAFSPLGAGGEDEDGPPTMMGHSLASILDGLIADGVIELGPDHRYRACRRYEGGQPWER